MTEEKNNSQYLFFKSSLCFEKPHRLTDVLSWHGHIPFAFVITEMLRPNVFVELGTHRGDSYCAFCQAVKNLKLNCTCHAVDTWKGDEQAGFYGDDIFREFRAYHDSLYGEFSNLMKMTFDEAIGRFPDDSIDLLHIDGCHTYEAARHDFESWLPKTSERGVVLFHDTNVRERNFGVRRLWGELKETYPSLEFTHSHGLGVLGVGKSIPQEVLAILNLEGDDETWVKNFFAALGDRIFMDGNIARLEEELSVCRSVPSLEAAIKERESAISDRDRRIRELENQAYDRLLRLVDKTDKLLQAELVLRMMKNSKAWRVAEFLRRMLGMFQQPM